MLTTLALVEDALGRLVESQRLDAIQIIVDEIGLAAVGCGPGGRRYNRVQVELPARLADDSLLLIAPGVLRVAARSIRHCQLQRQLRRSKALHG